MEDTSAHSAAADTQQRTVRYDPETTENADANLLRRASASPPTIFDARRDFNISLFTFNVNVPGDLLQRLVGRRAVIQLQVDTGSREVWLVSPSNEPEVYPCSSVATQPRSQYKLELKIQTESSSVDKTVTFFSSEDCDNFLQALEEGKGNIRKPSNLQADSDTITGSLVVGNNINSVSEPGDNNSTPLTVAFADSLVGSDSNGSNTAIEVADNVATSKIAGVLETDHVPLLSGEAMVGRVHRVGNLMPNFQHGRGVQGVLVITSYRIIFAPYDSSRNAAAFQLPRTAVDLIIRNELILRIMCKDMRTLRLAMHEPYVHKMGREALSRTLDPRWLNAITAHIKPPTKVGNLFAFAYHTGKVSMRRAPPLPEHDGWLVYSALNEYERLKFLTNHQDLEAEGAITWRLFENTKFRLSPTYPQFMVFPVAISERELTESARFRSHDRLPVAVWRHPRNKSVLVRSSRIKHGIIGNQSAADRFLLRLYQDAADLRLDRRPPLFIMGTLNRSPMPILRFTRSRMNERDDMIRNRPVLDRFGSYQDPFVDAHGTREGRRLERRVRRDVIPNGRLTRTEVENKHDYDNARVGFLEIINIHEMRDSWNALQKLIGQIIGGDDDRRFFRFFSQLESTGWPENIASVLSGARQVAEALDKQGESVLVHCDGGWDSTPQVVALAQLILDPYYRTIRGFAVLVEKEWCSFGHRFTDRIGVGRDITDQASERSPIMIQFLDCVWQMTRQFPSCFEFNEAFLLHIADALVSGLYGTFLYNSERARVIDKIAERTESAWTPVFEHPASFTNPLYQHTDRAIYPSASMWSVALWNTMYLRWDPKRHQDLKYMEYNAGETESCRDDEESDGINVIDQSSGNASGAIEMASGEVESDLENQNSFSNSLNKHNDDANFVISSETTAFSIPEEEGVSSAVASNQFYAQKEPLPSNSSSGNQSPHIDSVDARFARLLTRCGSMNEAEPLCHHVLTRLQHYVSPTSSTETENKASKAMVANVQAIAARFESIFKEQCDKPIVFRLVSARSLVNSLEDLHRRMDMFTTWIKDPAFHPWKSQWRQEAVKMKQNIVRAMKKKLPQLANELSTESLQNEMLTLFINELKYNREHYSDVELDLIHRVLGNIVGFSKLQVPEVEQWFIPRHEVQILQTELLGRGSFGKVYRGSWRKTDVVVKCIAIASETEKRAFFREVKVWRQARHPNVVRFFGAWHLSSPYFIVSEYARGGSLMDYLYTQREAGEFVVWRKMLEVVRGLFYLHEERIVHGDLKGDNILVSKDGTAMLVDFGLSFVQSGSVVTMEKWGAIRWRAPEYVIQGGAGPSPAADVYSLGMCIVEAVTGSIPWGPIMPDIAVAACLRRKEMLKRPLCDAMTDEAWELVSSMPCFDPSERLPLAAVVETLEEFAADEKEYEQLACKPPTVVDDSPITIQTEQ